MLGLRVSLCNSIMVGAYRNLKFGVLYFNFSTVMLVFIFNSFLVCVSVPFSE